MSLVESDSLLIVHDPLIFNSSNSITCPEDVVVDAQDGMCGAVVNFDDAVSTVAESEEIVMIFNGENVFDSPYIEREMRLDGIDGSHIDAPWPIPCDNREGALIHRDTGNTWTYKGGQPFTPLRFYACTTNMKFTTGCGATFIPTQTGEVEFPDTPEWQNITSMVWEQYGDDQDASIDNFRFKATPVRQLPGLESGCFFPVGTTPVTFVSTDANGDQTQCTFNVTVRDVESPAFEVQDIDIELGDDFTETISEDDVLRAMPTDNCGIDTISLSQYTFSCSDQGNTAIDVVVTDVNGNTTTKQVIVNVLTDASNFPVIESIEDTAVCGTFILADLNGDNLSGNQAYFTEPLGQGERYEIGEQLSVASFDQYPVTLYAYDNPSASDCFAQVAFELSIEQAPVIDNIENIQACETYLLPMISGENISTTAAYYSQENGNGDRYEPGATITSEDFPNSITLYAYDTSEVADCISQQSFTVDLSACSLQVVIEASATTLCSSDLEGVTLTAQPQSTGPTTNYSYSWKIIGSSQIISTAQTIEVLPEQTTQYEVLITDTAAAQGFNTARDEVSITISDAPTANIPNMVTMCITDNPSIGSNFVLADYNYLFHENFTQFDINYYESIDDALNDENRLPPSLNLNTGETTLYTRVANATTQCFDTSMITFMIDPLLQISLADEYAVCPNTLSGDAVDPVIISIDLSNEDYEFYWTRQHDGLSEVVDNTSNSLSTVEQGIYTIDITSFLTGCSTQVQTRIIENSQPAEVSIDSDFVTNIDSHEITVVVTATNDQPSQYQVSIEEGVWYDMDDQGSSFHYTFRRVETEDGLQEVAVRDLQGCFYEKQEVITIGVPQYFTPNGDGYNDTWNIRGGKNLDPSTQLLLYDRYGKLLIELAIDGNGWDGTYNGQPLPSTDYWFTLRTANDKVTRGHFALKR